MTDSLQTRFGAKLVVLLFYKETCREAMKFHHKERRREAWVCCCNWHSCGVQQCCHGLRSIGVNLLCCIGWMNCSAILRWSRGVSINAGSLWRLDWSPRHRPAAGIDVLAVEEEPLKRCNVKLSHIDYPTWGNWSASLILVFIWFISISMFKLMTLRGK